MAENEEKKNTKKKKKRRGGSSKFLTIGKYFLVLLFFATQGLLAYMLTDKYYPSVYEHMNKKTPADFVTYQMEELVVNPANTNGKRYLMVEISLELDDKADIQKIEQHKLRLKQEIMETLSSRSIPELVKVSERDKLRSEIIMLINSTIGVRSVRNLYFTKYVMQ